MLHISAEIMHLSRVLSCCLSAVLQLLFRSKSYKQTKALKLTFLLWKSCEEIHKLPSESVRFFLSRSPLLTKLANEKEKYVIIYFCQPIRDNFYFVFTAQRGQQENNSLSRKFSLMTTWKRITASHVHMHFVFKSSLVWKHSLMLLPKFEALFRTKSLLFSNSLWNKLTQIIIIYITSSLVFQITHKHETWKWNIKTWNMDMLYIKVL